MPRLTADKQGRAFSQNRCHCWLLLAVGVGEEEEEEEEEHGRPDSRRLATPGQRDGEEEVKRVFHLSRSIVAH